MRYTAAFFLILFVSNSCFSAGGETFPDTYEKSSIKAPNLEELKTSRNWPAYYKETAKWLTHQATTEDRALWFDAALEQVQSLAAELIDLKARQRETPTVEGHMFRVAGKKENLQPRIDALESQLTNEFLGFFQHYTLPIEEVQKILKAGRKPARRGLIVGVPMFIATILHPIPPFSLLALVGTVAMFHGGMARDVYRQKAWALWHEKARAREFLNHAARLTMNDRNYLLKTLRALQGESNSVQLETLLNAFVQQIENQCNVILKETKALPPAGP